MVVKIVLTLHLALTAIFITVLLDQTVLDVILIIVYHVQQTKTNVFSVFLDILEHNAANALLVAQIVLDIVLRYVLHVMMDTISIQILALLALQDVVIVLG